MNKLIKGICIAASLCFIIIACTAFTENPEEKEIKNLIIRRTDVMESVLFGKITYEEGCRQLAEVETGKLYSDDIEKIKNCQQTDLEKTESIHFVSIEKKTSMFDKVSYTAEIKWTESYGMNIASCTYKYDVGAQKREGEYKLTTFEIQQE